MEQASLFQTSDRETQPLAARLRPQTLSEFVGQKHLIGEGKVLRRLIESDRIASMIFWGPPGVGKTTLARIIAVHTKSSFIDFSAVTSGIKEIRGVMQQAEENRRYGDRTIVFVDEIHRFNKAQQDAFLPFVEKGSIILIGATTENPSFEVNGALLSRCKVFVLQPLSTEDVVSLLSRALTDERGFGGQKIKIAPEHLEVIAGFANGDARSALSTLEMVVLNGEEKKGTITVTKEILEQCISRKSLLYDKKGEEHYNLISALHKSMRNSDPDAAVYWLARMLEAGEDPLYVARRVTRFASEDVGLADPRALEIGGLSRDGAEVQRDGGRLSDGAGGRAQGNRRAGAAGDSKRAHKADEGTRLWKGLSIRPRHAGKNHEHAVPARFAARQGILPADGAGRRGKVQGASCGNQGMEARPRRENMKKSSFFKGNEKLRRTKGAAEFLRGSGFIRCFPVIAGAVRSKGSAR